MTHDIKLHPRSLRVAELVAAGDTDKAIAAKLGLAVRTVRYHIRVIAVAWNLDPAKVTRVEIANRVPKKAA
jgi:DNA-binding NarL/FixJ family response regulator